MQIGVSSYSFSRELDNEVMDIFQVIEASAKMGFAGIEFTDFGPKEAQNNQVSVAGRVRERCEACGLPVLCYTIGADFIKPKNGGDWKDEVERLKGQLEIAKALGAPMMRHDVTKIESVDLADFISGLPAMTRGCRAVTEYAADLGIKTMFENHGYLVGDSERCILLLDEVDHPNMGALVDIANFTGNDEDPVTATARLAPRAFHVHAKDVHIKPASTEPGDEWWPTRGGNWIRGAVVGHGNVDVPGCLKALKKAGYSGYLAIEFEGMEDTTQALEIGHRNLQNYISKLA